MCRWSTVIPMPKPSTPLPPVPRGRHLRDVSSRRDAWRAGDVASTVLRVVSVVVVCVAVWVLGDVVWSNTGANVAAEARQVELAQRPLPDESLPPRTGSAPASDSAEVPSGSSAASREASEPVLPPPIPVIETPVAPGEVFGRLLIPRFGSDWVRPIAESVEVEVLDSIGVGHYEGSAYPGGVGNVGLAAHRTTHGATFMDLDTLAPGDEVIIETADGRYVYVVESSDVVSPDAVEVVAPVPNRPGETPTERWLTMTTCTPKFTTLQRLVVWARFARWEPRRAE